MIEGEYKKIMAYIDHLDQYLGAYGPETREIRTHLRHVAARTFKERWPGEDFGPIGPPSEGGPNRLIDGQRMLVELEPASEVQRWFQAQALLVSAELAKLRWLVVSQEMSTAPLLPVFVLIFLSAISIFGGFGLYAPPNATLFAVLVLPGTRHYRGDVLLVIELNSPFHGPLQISSRGAHALMQSLAQVLLETGAIPQWGAASIFRPAARPRRATAFSPWRAKASGSGLHSAMVADHIVFPVESESTYPYTLDGKHPSVGDALETFSILGVVAGATERLRLVTSVLVLPYRNPVLTAKMAASLDVLSGGRLTLGVGAGWLKEEFEALDSPAFERAAP